ncbi:helix-turn-helix domain-containing protein [Silvanigrella paludirubra]|jgi:hypothetical protein|nr:helix-turn-helix transcriptional regulator [Silvanigrella paludirubra]MBX9837513.1 helix-turn-helix domain-containing protein [Silvanigrellaceae bacterium]
MTTKVKHMTNKGGDSIREFIDGVTFGEYVRTLREADGMTQQELADKIGSKKQFISAVETGREKVGLDYANRIAIAMGYSLAPFAKILINEQLKEYDPTLEIDIRSKKAS